MFVWGEMLFNSSGVPVVRAQYLQTHKQSISKQPYSAIVEEPVGVHFIFAEPFQEMHRSLLANLNVFWCFHVVKFSLPPELIPLLWLHLNAADAFNQVFSSLCRGTSASSKIQRYSWMTKTVMCPLGWFLNEGLNVSYSTCFLWSYLTRVKTSARDKAWFGAFILLL